MGTKSCLRDLYEAHSTHHAISSSDLILFDHFSKWRNDRPGSIRVAWRSRGPFRRIIRCLTTLLRRGHVVFAKWESTHIGDSHDDDERCDFIVTYKEHYISERHFFLVVNQSVNQSNDNSTNQSIHQLINHQFKQWINPSCNALYPDPIRRIWSSSLQQVQDLCCIAFDTRSSGCPQCWLSSQSEPCSWTIDSWLDYLLK